MAGYLLAGVALLWALRQQILGAAAARRLAGAAGSRPRRHLPGSPPHWSSDWVDIKQATEDPGYNFENNWLFAHTPTRCSRCTTQILHQVSWIAVSMIAVAVAGIADQLAARHICPAKTAASRLWWIPLAPFPSWSLLSQFPFSRPLWNLLPEMRFLQYPWRWLEAVEAPMAIFFVAAVWPSAAALRAAVLVALRRMVSGVDGLCGDRSSSRSATTKTRRLGALRLPRRRGL